jgi:ketosteroid isomerase-like protein
MRNRLRIAATAPGGKPMVRFGYTLTVLRKEADGCWVIARRKSANARG